MKTTFVILFITLFSALHAQDLDWVSKSDSIVQIAQSQIGVKYVWGTSKADVSFDCSGFTSYVYTTSNVSASRSSKNYIKMGESVALENCRKGDCIVFSGTKIGDRTPGHVGIIVENNEDGIQFIHCSSSKKHSGVVVTDYYSSGYPKRFLAVRRMY